MTELFSPILDKDEEIIKVYKPSKAKMFFSYFFGGFWIWCWVLLLFVPDSCSVEDAAGNVTPIEWWVPLTVALSVIGVCLFFEILFFILSYKNTYYAYTNKRIVIRRGIFGVDYKSLDMDMIGAVTVNVSLLDKIICKNTGTIVFGSMASPINNAGVFRYTHIVDPYNTYKEIKSVIDEHKSNVGK